MEFREQVERAVEPLLFALEDAIASKSRLGLLNPTARSSSSAEDAAWQWFCKLETLADKRHALQITNAGFLDDLFALVKLDQASAATAASMACFQSFSPISKPDLLVLHKLGDLDTKFTNRAYFPGQRSKLLCDGLGIEFGLQTEVDCLLAGRILLGNLMTCASVDRGGIVVLSSNLLEMCSIGELEALLHKASFGRFFLPHQPPVHDPSTTFTLGEFVCRELRAALQRSFRASALAAAPSPSVSQIALFWEACPKHARARVYSKAIRRLMAAGTGLIKPTSTSTMEDVELCPVVIESNTFFYSIDRAGASFALDCLVSEEIALEYKERTAESFLLELNEEAAAETQARERRKKKQQQQQQANKKKQEKKPASPSTVPLAPVKVQHTIDLSQVPLPAASPEPPPPLSPPQQPHISADLEALSENSDATAAVSPLAPNAPDLSPLLSMLNLLVDQVAQLAKSQEEIKQSIADLKQSIAQSAPPPPIAPSPATIPQPAPAIPQPAPAPAKPQPAPAPEPAPTPTPPPAQQQQHYTHPFFSHHNNAINHFRTPPVSQYFPHYPSPPQPVFARPHEWHGTETVAFHSQQPSTTTVLPAHLSSQQQQQQQQPISRHLSVPQLFEHGLLPVDPVVSANLTRGIYSFAEHCRTARLRKEPLETAALGLMQALVESLWPRARVKAFGSSQTGLALPDSDMDLVVCLPKVRIEDPEERMTWQQKLSTALTQCSWVQAETLKRIQHAPMPIITLETKQAVRLDISFQSETHFGLETNKLINALQHELRMLRPLVLVLKQFLHDRGLSKGFSGGLSSYALTIMCACFLQASSRLVINGNSNNNSSMQARAGETGGDDAGILLVCFLRFFGEQFDPRATGISISRGFFQRHLVVSPPPPVLASPPPQSSSASFAQNQSFASTVAPSLPARRRSFRIEDLAVSGQPAADPATMMATTVEHYHHVMPVPDPFAQHKFDPLLIEDPMQPGNNLGRNVFRIHQIQRACADSAKALKTPGAWPLGSIVNSWRPEFSSSTTPHKGRTGRGGVDGSSGGGVDKGSKPIRGNSMDLGH